MVISPSSEPLNRPRPLPDEHWTAVADFLISRGVTDELILAPNEFIHQFPGTMAIHVRRNMIPDAVIRWFVIHKGMLSRIDPAMLREAVSCVPVFANDVFAVFSSEGPPLFDLRDVKAVLDFGQTLPVPPSSGRVGIVVTAYNRPWALKRTLRSLRRLGAPILVVDDGSPLIVRLRHRLLARAASATFLQLPRNLGVAQAHNIGISFWLAQLDCEWISMFDDDCEAVPDTLDVLRRVSCDYPHDRTLFTGYRSPCHMEHGETEIGGHRVLLSRSCSGQHLHAHRDYWTIVLPIPTTYPMAPRSTGGVFAGQGSDQDWWVSCWCPRAGIKRGGEVVVVPGLVTTFGAGHSSWGSSGL